MHDLIVLGGAQRPAVKSLAEDWLLFERAVAARVSSANGAYETCFSWETPLPARASAQSSVLFKSGHVDGDRLYACTSTEILVLDLQFKLESNLSLPCFNDLHHVRPTPQGTLIVAVTGLDMVAEISRDGRLLRTWNAGDTDTWKRFDRTTDYRKFATLKPYQAHPNFVFYIDGEAWVTRGDRADAICLTDPARRIVLPTGQCVHDGWVEAGFIYFTAVDGHLFVINAATLRWEAIYDLNTMAGADPTGYSWCRGVIPAGLDQAWVGFTRIRPTRWKEKIRWVKNLVHPVSRPTRLALYDLNQRALLREINLEPAGLHAVFSALPLASASAVAQLATGN